MTSGSSILPGDVIHLEKSDFREFLGNYREQFPKEIKHYVELNSEEMIIYVSIVHRFSYVNMIRKNGSVGLILCVLVMLIKTILQFSSQCLFLLVISFTVYRPSHLKANLPLFVGNKTKG